jgi:hypothetical protein
VIHVSYDKSFPNDTSVVDSDQFPVDAALGDAFRAGYLSNDEAQKLQAALSKGNCKLMKQLTLQLITPEVTFVFDNLGEEIILVV